MHYNVLRPSVKSRNKSVYRWYYSFIDPSTGIKKQHVIPDCHNRADAYAYIQMLPDPDRKVVLIKDICKDMFIPGSAHIERLEQHGKSITIETCMRHRRTINVIVKQFGELELKDITVTAVDNFLRADTKHKRSRKNAFLETLNYVYKEAPFFGCTGIVKPPPSLTLHVIQKKQISLQQKSWNFYSIKVNGQMRETILLFCVWYPLD